jgi:hypothetical protein
MADPIGYVVQENYNFNNLQLVLAGYDLVKLKGFKFGEETEVDLSYGKNGMLVGYGIKKFKNPNITVTILFEELQKLIELAKPYGGRIGKLPPMPLQAILTAEDKPTFKYVSVIRPIKYDVDLKEGNSETEVALELLVLSDPVLTFA